MGSTIASLGRDAARMTGLLALGLACAAGVATVSHAQQATFGADAAVVPDASAAGTAMYSDLGAISGIGDKIYMTRVPVKTSAGTIVYRDVTISFDVSASGGLTMTAGYPIVVASPPLITGNFRAGNYKDTFGHKYVVASPGALGGGRTKWTLKWAIPAGQAGALDVTWVTGPVAGHPFEERLRAHNISASTYSWGIVGQASTTTPGFPYPPFGVQSGGAIGVWQTGDQLEIHVFTGSGVDVGHFFLTRCAAAC
jgi:hypothetical protein